MLIRSNGLVGPVGPNIALCVGGPTERLIASRIGVTITPQALPFGGVPVPRDSNGNLLHCLWTFPRPRREVGRRVHYHPQAPAVANDDTSPIVAETDPGDFCIKWPAFLTFIGGGVGDAYDIRVTLSVDRREEGKQSDEIAEPTFEGILTSVVAAPGTVQPGSIYTPPAGHQLMRILQYPNTVPIVLQTGWQPAQAVFVAANTTWVIQSRIVL